MPRQASNAASIIASLHIMGWKSRDIAEVVGMSRERVKDLLRSEEGSQAILAMKQETQKQIFDPVQRKLEEYAIDAADELWEMRLEVESEQVKANILKEIMHMAGYRPHTNIDKKSDDLPTIVIGQMNIGTPGESNLPLEVSSTFTEVTDGTQEVQDSISADEQVALAEVSVIPDAEENDSGDLGGAGWPYREVQHGESGTGEECEGNERKQQAVHTNGQATGIASGREE